MVGLLVNLGVAPRRAAPSAAEEEKVRLVGISERRIAASDRVQFHSPCTQIDLCSIGRPCPDRVA
jgi:hypothetical protein